MDQVLIQHRVRGLLRVTWAWERSSRGRRGGRYVITAVDRDAAAVAAALRRLGWQVLVTNLPADRLPLAAGAQTYRAGWCLERDFHLVKDRPLGISPLYVRTDNQIVGLTRLLALALRVLILFETQVRAGLRQTGAALTGLYAGQPHLATNRPTAIALLHAFCRAQITLTQIDLGGQRHWHITPLPPLLRQILTYLGAPPDLYERLAIPT